MDVAASFQFLVDALATRLVRDRAGLARLRQERLAAARLLVRGLHRRPRRAGQRVRTRRKGQSRGPQPGRQRRDALCGRASGEGRGDHFARRLRHSGRGLRRGAAPSSPNGWTPCSNRRNSRPTRASTRSPTDCRRTIGACRATRRCSSPGNGQSKPRRVACGLVSDPRHRLPFPSVYRIEEAYAVWRNIAAPALWIAAADSHIPKWLSGHPEGEGATDSLAVVRQRLEQIPNGRLVTIADAGHMLHHDQPHAVAAAMEAFLADVR